MPPIEVGLIPTQQDSFEHHEELSKLLNESEVFYVPLRNEINEKNSGNELDRSDLTSKFDEDLSNRHLIVTFRDIGYSLFLDSVESLPDETDRSKLRVSGKMIVDGICVQFVGRFDNVKKLEKNGEPSTQQISGVGRVELDKNYYQKLSSIEIISNSNDVKPDEENSSQTTNGPKVRRTNSKIKDRIHPRSSPLKIRTTLDSNSQTSSNSLPTRTHPHSTNSKPYSTKSSRTNKNSTSLETSPKPMIEPNRNNFQFPSNPTAFSLPNSSNIEMTQKTYPNLVQTATIGQFPSLIQFVPTNSFSNYFPSINNVGSVRNNILQPNKDFPSVQNSTGMFLIMSPGQTASQPIHILTPVDYHSIQVGFPGSNNPLIPTPLTFIQSCNNFPNLNSNSISKRSETNTNTMELVKQSEEQLPFKKRRHADRPTPLQNDDDQPDDDSSKN